MLVNFRMSIDLCKETFFTLIGTFFYTVVISQMLYVHSTAKVKNSFYKPFPVPFPSRL